MARVILPGICQKNPEKPNFLEFGRNPRNKSPKTNIRFWEKFQRFFSLEFPSIFRSYFLGFIPWISPGIFHLIFSLYFYASHFKLSDVVRLIIQRFDELYYIFYFS